MRPIFKVEGPKFLKGPQSRSFSYTKIAHTKVQKPVTVKACLVSPRLWWLLQACDKLEKPVQFPDQFQFSPYQQHHRSSLQLPTSTIAFALPKGSFSRLPHASRFLRSRKLFLHSGFADFAVAVGIFCAQFFWVCFFGLVVCLFVSCTFLFKMQHQLLHACELVIC